MCSFLNSFLKNSGNSFHSDADISWWCQCTNEDSIFKLNMFLFSCLLIFKANPNMWRKTQILPIWKEQKQLKPSFKISKLLWEYYRQKIVQKEFF